MYNFRWKAIFMFLFFLSPFTFLHQWWFSLIHVFKRYQEVLPDILHLYLKGCVYIQHFKGVDWQFLLIRKMGYLIFFIHIIISKLLGIIRRSRLIPSLELSGKSLYDCFPIRYFCKKDETSEVVNAWKTVIWVTLLV